MWSLWQFQKWNDIICFQKGFRNSLHGFLFIPPPTTILFRQPHYQWSWCLALHSPVVWLPLAAMPASCSKLHIITLPASGPVGTGCSFLFIFEDNFKATLCTGFGSNSPTKTTSLWWIVGQLSARSTNQFCLSGPIDRHTDTESQTEPACVLYRPQLQSFRQ